MADIEHIVVDLKEENKRLLEDLNFERNMNNILENIRNNSLVLMQNCKCIENNKLFKVIKQFNNIYTDLKTKQNLMKRSNNSNNNNNNINRKLIDCKQTNKSIPKTDIGPNERKRMATQRNIEDIRRVDTNNSLSLKSDSNSGFSLITELLQMKARNGDHWGQQSDNTCNPSIEIIEVKDETNTSAEHQCNQCEQCFDTETELNLHTSRVHNRVVRSASMQAKWSLAMSSESLDWTAIDSETMSSIESEANSSNPCQRVGPEKASADRFVCMNCHQVFASKQILLSHQSEVHQMFVYSCDLCDYKTERKQTIGRHREAMHCDQKRYKCPVEGCDKWFKTNHNISAHKKKAHQIFP